MSEFEERYFPRFENGGRDIWPYLLLHGTHNIELCSLSLVVTEQDIQTH